MFRLNQYAVACNGMAGAHDPSMLYDPVTKRYYSYGTDIYGPPLGLPDAIGIPIRSSSNLVDFQYEGLALSPEAIAEDATMECFRPLSTSGPPMWNMSGGSTACTTPRPGPSAVRIPDLAGRGSKSPGPL